MAGKLTAADGDIFFRTPGGRQTLEALSQRVSRGIDITPAEVVEALAAREAYTAYRAIGDKLAAENAQLRKDIARYAAADPAKVRDGSSQTSGSPATTSGFDITRMFG